MGRKRQ